MADVNVTRKLNSLQRNCNSVENSDHNCLKCDELVIQLEETRKELSSSQLVIKLLYKEINDITSVKSFTPASTNYECKTGGSTNKWSYIASKRMYKASKARDFHTYQITQSVESVNRYSVLANLPEADNCHNCHDENGSSKVMKITKVPQIPINNYVKRKDHGKIRYSAVTLQPWSIVQPETPNHQEGKGESMKDQMSSYIPTLVNGQIKPIKIDNNINIMNNNLDLIQNLLSESTVQLINNKGKYTNCCSHEVLGLGDSHIWGCAAKLIASLDAHFDVCGVVKPGSFTGSLMETLKSEVEKLTKNDFLIICSRTNDIDRNESRNAFINITEFVERVNNTNIILTSVPYRHDLMDFSDVNNKIKSFNIKLLKLAKVYSHVSIIETVNNRLLFTKHGLHLNESGKELLTNQLLLHIFSMLNEVKVKPISIGWYDEKHQADVSSKASQTITPENCQLATEQEPKHVRKVPVTRKYDFLWKI
jgi:hypothetical protein